VPKELQKLPPSAICFGASPAVQGHAELVLHTNEARNPKRAKEPYIGENRMVIGPKYSRLAARESKRRQLMQRVVAAGVGQRFAAEDPN
jgi:hypothetical protein